MKIAIPTMGAGGLGCERSGHFGHCDCFTVVTVEDGTITATEVIDNPPHEEGGCMRPVSLLAGHGVDAIVAAGMGMRPMMGFARAGYYGLLRERDPECGRGREHGRRRHPAPSWARSTPATTSLQTMRISE